MKNLLMTLMILIGSCFNTIPVHSQNVPAGAGKPKVILFLAARCPCAYNHQETFASILEEYNGKAEFLAVFVGENDDKEEVEDLMKNIGWNLPYIIDKEKKYVKKFNASVTTEVFLVDSSDHVVFRGAIDDSPVNMGQVVNFYLQDAMEDYFSGEPVRVGETKLIGCSINL